MAAQLKLFSVFSLLLQAPSVISDESLEKCLESAEPYCDQFWQQECNCVEDKIESEYKTWAFSCEYALCDASSSNLADYSYEDATVNGWFDNVMGTCTLECGVDPSSGGVTSDAPTEEPTEEPSEEPTEEPTEMPTERDTTGTDGDTGTTGAPSGVCEEEDYYLVITGVSDSNYDWAVGRYDAYTEDGNSLQNGDSTDTVILGKDSNIDAGGNYVLQNVDILLTSDPDTAYAILISTVSMSNDNDMSSIAGATEWDQYENETPVEVEISVVDCVTNEEVVTCEKDCITVSGVDMASKKFEMMYGITSDTFEGEYCWDEGSGYYWQSDSEIGDFDNDGITDSAALGLFDCGADKFCLGIQLKASQEAETIDAYVEKAWDTDMYGDDLACQDNIDAFLSSEGVVGEDWMVETQGTDDEDTMTVGTMEFSDCIGVDFNCEASAAAMGIVFNWRSVFGVVVVTTVYAIINGLL